MTDVGLLHTKRRYVCYFAQVLDIIICNIASNYKYYTSSCPLFNILYNYYNAVNVSVSVLLLMLLSLKYSFINIV